MPLNIDQGDNVGRTESPYLSTTLELFKVNHECLEGIDVETVIVPKWTLKIDITPNQTLRETSRVLLIIASKPSFAILRVR